MIDKVYNSIVKHYENCLEEHGASAKGMDWPNEEDLQRRFQVMLEVITPPAGPASVLDLGCGVGLLADYIKSCNLADISYWGIDISAKMAEVAAKRHPEHRFEVRDILSQPLTEQCVDYIVMNGVLTEKRELSQEEMVAYAKEIIKAAFSACRKGIAFNVMSSHVEWFRDDLFHLPLDEIVAFLTSQCSRHIAIRMDYGLYEYTVYLYRQPCPCKS